MPILHGVNGSPFVRKVRVALAEKGIQYDLNPIMPFGQTDEYKAKSPLGKIPCYEDGDYVLPDSSCIIAYLEVSQPEPRLYPTDPKEFGRALWYEEHADSRLTDAIGGVFFERYVKKNLLKQEPDEEKIARHMNDLIPVAFGYLEGEIGDREHLVGAHFSIADLATASPFVNFRYAGETVDASRWPNLAAYIDRIHARPSYKAIIEEELAGQG